MHLTMFYLRFGAAGEVHIVNMGPGEWVFSPTAKTLPLVPKAPSTEKISVSVKPPCVHMCAHTPTPPGPAFNISQSTRYYMRQVKLVSSSAHNDTWVTVSVTCPKSHN